jgi:hypothetical protein
MTKGLLLVLVVAFGLVGCAGLRQFPETSQDTKALETLDEEYNKALVKAYGTVDEPKAVDATLRRDIRNRLIEGRMAVIDAHFKTFEAGLVKENVRVDFGLALVGIGVGAAGSLVAQTASQILSAVSGGLAGAQAAYGKSVLYDKALSALVAQMHAGRKAIAAQIFQRWALDIEKYPMWMARTDLDAYYFAGSLPGAILSTAADAKTKEVQADAILLRSTTAVSVSPAMFQRRAALVRSVEALENPKAKALLEQIAAQSADAKAFIDDQLPPAQRTADDGTKAKNVLKRAVSETVKAPEDADMWQTAIGGL